MASVSVKPMVLFVAGLVVPAAAGEDGLKTVGSINCQLATNLQSPLEVKSSLKGSLQETAGPFKSSLQGPLSLWPPSAAARTMLLEKKHGAFTCTLSSTDGSPTASISGGKKISGANVKGTLSSPAQWPMKPSGSISVQKDIGGMSCTLKTASFPLKQKMTELEVSNLGTLSLGQKIQEFDCSLTGTISEKGGNMMLGNGKVSAKRSVDTPIGPVCGVLETSVDAPSKAVGTVSWKKKLGSVCCKVEATSKGAVRCTFDSDAQFTVMKSEKSEVAPDGSMTISVVAFIGFAVGCIITFVMFRPGRGTSTVGKQHLLA